MPKGYTISPDNISAFKETTFNKLPEALQKISDDNFTTIQEYISSKLGKNLAKLPVLSKDTESVARHLSSDKKTQSLALNLVKNIVGFLEGKNSLDEATIKSQYSEFPEFLKVDDKFIDVLKNVSSIEKANLVNYYKNEIKEAGTRLARLQNANAETLSVQLSEITKALQKPDKSIDAFSFYCRDMTIPRPVCESYSNIFDTRGHLNPQGLMMLSIMSHIASSGDKIALTNCGLAEDYCVGNTALDLVALAKMTGNKERFKVIVISDATDHIVPEQRTAIHDKFNKSGVSLMTQKQYAEALKNKFEELIDS